MDLQSVAFRCAGGSVFDMRRLRRSRGVKPGWLRNYRDRH